MERPPDDFSTPPSVGLDPWHGEEASRPREAFRSLANRIPVPIWIAAPSGTVQFLNDHWERATGQPPGDGLGWGWIDVVHPEDRERFLGGWRAALAAGVEYENEVRYRTPRGRYHWFSVRAQPVSVDGGLVQWCGLSIDVEARKRTERDLQARTEAVVDSAVDAIVTIDEAGRIESVNPACERMFGYSRDELGGRNVRTLMPEPHRSEHDGYLEHYRRTGERRIIGIGREVWGRHRDGSTFPVQLAVSEARLGDHRIFTGILRDISEQKRVEAALTESRRRLETLIANLPGMAYRARPDARRTLEFASAGCRELTGYTPHELVDERAAYYGDLIHPDDRDRVGREIAAALAGGRPFTLAYRLRSRGGDELSVWEQGCGVPGGGGDVVALEGFVSDTSERRRLQDELLQAQKMEAVGRLAGGIAHDFNNLLMGVIGTTRSIGRLLPEQHPARPLLQELQQEAYKGAGLTRQLLDFSRKRPRSRRPVELNAVASESHVMLGKLLGEDVELSVRLAVGGGRIVADPGQIDQILMNLCVNARDAMPGGGTLRVEVAEVDVGVDDPAHPARLEPGRWVVLTVADTGCGMDEETRLRVFEPFFTTKGVGKGTGLGLSTVFGLVREFGGTIDVASAPGGGTTFRLYFPETREALDPNVVPREEAASVPVRSERATLLVVEDEKLVRTSLRHMLDDVGFEVLTAGDADEAREVLERHGRPIDLLLTDIVMPGTSGPELAERVVAEHPDTAVLFMSAFSAETLGEQGRLEPGRALIEKPFEEEALVAEIRRLLAARR